MYIFEDLTCFIFTETCVNGEPGFTLSSDLRFINMLFIIDHKFLMPECSKIRVRMWIFYINEFVFQTKKVSLFSKSSFVFQTIGIYSKQIRMTITIQLFLIYNLMLQIQTESYELNGGLWSIIGSVLNTIRIDHIVACNSESCYKWVPTIIPVITIVPLTPAIDDM